MRVQKLTGKHIRILRRSRSEEIVLPPKMVEFSAHANDQQFSQLTPKERMRKRKEEEASKRRMELELAAMDNAKQRIMIRERAAKMLQGVSSLAI